METMVKIQTTQSRMRRLKEKHREEPYVVCEYRRSVNRKLKYPVREDDNFRQFRWDVLIVHDGIIGQDFFRSVKEFETYMDNL